MKLNRTLRDCVYGMAVGDALGVPFEFKPRGSFECVDMVGGGSHNQLAGTWSDDTSMALALCDSYRELGRVDCDDILRRFRAWINDGAYTADGVAFDYGNATRKALATGRGGAGEWDKGNGSLRSCCLMAAIIAPSYFQTPCSGGFFIFRSWKPPVTMAQDSTQSRLFPWATTENAPNRVVFFSPYGPFMEKSAFVCRKSRNPRVETPPQWA